MENLLIVLVLIFSALAVFLGLRLVWKETSPRQHEHEWRWVVRSYMQQCSVCGFIEIRRDAAPGRVRDELADGLQSYVEFLNEYHKTRMFPKSGVVGYHAYRSGCCPLAESDPIHDPEILKQIKEGTF